MAYFYTKESPDGKKPCKAHNAKRVVVVEVVCTGHLGPLQSMDSHFILALVEDIIWRTKLCDNILAYIAQAHLFAKQNAEGNNWRIIKIHHVMNRDERRMSRLSRKGLRIKPCINIRVGILLLLYLFLLRRKLQLKIFCHLVN